MVPVNRRATYKLYPSREQEANLWQCLKLHCDLYTAARREPIDAYRLAGKSISYADQCRSLREIRADHAEYRALNNPHKSLSSGWTTQGVLSFFRCKPVRGRAFPGSKNMTGSPGSGSSITAMTSASGGKLRLSGIGFMDLAVNPETPGQIIPCDILRKVDG